MSMPEKYGIYQSVGDTVGIGGIFRSWRTVPMIAEIAENVKKYCPEAWGSKFYQSYEATVSKGII